MIIATEVTMTSRRTARDRDAPRCVNGESVVTRIVVPAARSAARNSADQPAALRPRHAQRQWLVGGVLSLVIAMAASTAAHHSFAVFDHTRTLTIRGTVTKFQWTNPHGFLEVDIPQPDGTTKHFSIELTSINMMQRVGWRSNMIKAGDKVTAIVAPLLSGEPVGLGLEVTMADGSTKALPVPNAASFKRTTETQ